MIERIYNIMQSANTWFISDTHFGHIGSLRWPNGANRPFESIDIMDKTIIDNWNSIVTSEDIVFHLGDFSYRARPSRIKDIMSALNGNIVLIKGNHDRDTLKANNEIHRFLAVYERLELKFKDAHLVLDHYPIFSWHQKNRGSIHLHGHVHGRPTGITGNIMDLSCEVINYTPISIEEVLLKFKKNGYT